MLANPLLYSEPSSQSPRISRGFRPGQREVSSPLFHTVRRTFRPSVESRSPACPPFPTAWALAMRIQKHPAQQHRVPPARPPPAVPLHPKSTWSGADAPVTFWHSSPAERLSSSGPDEAQLVAPPLPPGQICVLGQDAAVDKGSDSKWPYIGHSAEFPAPGSPGPGAGRLP